MGPPGGTGAVLPILLLIIQRMIEALWARWTTAEAMAVIEIVTGVCWSEMEAENVLWVVVAAAGIIPIGGILLFRTIGVIVIVSRGAAIMDPPVDR